MSYRYLGNKSRLKDWIADLVGERLSSGATVADPMCGTASVSAELASRGFKVIASDQLRFPVLHAQARLLHDGSFNFTPAGKTYEQCIESLNDLAPVRGFFWREYSDEGTPANGSRPRKYLTGANAARVDAIREQIKQWRELGLNRFSADLLLHDLILAVNRVANISGTYGYYLSSWNGSSLGQLRVRPTPASAHSQEHRVLHGCAKDIVGAIDVDAVYLDPPYTKRQYGGNYHLPETLAQEDEPTPLGQGGLRDWSVQASDFCYRRKVKGAFTSILDSIRADWVFISYSEDAHLPTDELMDLLANYGRVDFRDQPLDRFRSNDRVARQGPVREHLYILEMRDAGSIKSGGVVDEETAAL